MGKNSASLPAPEAVFEGKGTFSTFPYPQKLLFIMENPIGRTAINLKPKHFKVGERAPEKLRRPVEPNPFCHGKSSWTHNVHL